MHHILFVCLGNICRSTMAQFVMTDLVSRAGRADEFVIDSAGTSDEERGNPPHHLQAAFRGRPRACASRPPRARR